MSEIIISNEQDAWEFFQKATHNNLEDLGEFFDLSFRGWPKLEIKISGRDFNASVPTRIMPALLDLQKEIHRTYCLLRYGEENLRKLTQDERELLELVVTVGEGSSLFGVDLDKILNTAVGSAIKKMESRHITIIVLAAALGYTSSVMWKDWLDSQARQKEVESRVAMSQEETKRLEVFSKALATVPEVESVKAGANEFMNHSLHRLQAQDKLVVPGTAVEIDGTYASEVTYKPREASVEIRLDAEFLIESVDSGRMRGYRLKVVRVVDGKALQVTIPEGAITQEQLDVLKDAEWAKRPVLMEINARQLRDKITSATLVSAKAIPYTLQKPE